MFDQAPDFITLPGAYMTAHRLERADPGRVTTAPLPAGEERDWGSGPASKTRPSGLGTNMNGYSGVSTLALVSRW